MRFSRSTRERAFLCARTWPPGVRPDGETGPAPVGANVAVKVRGRWRSALVVSPTGVVWVDASEARLPVLHLFDLGDEVRSWMERRWGVSSPPHPPPADGREPWDRVTVNREPIEGAELIRLDKG